MRKISTDVIFSVSSVRVLQYGNFLGQVGCGLDRYLLLYKVERCSTIVAVLYVIILVVVV